MAALLLRQKHLDQRLESAKPKLRIVADGTQEDPEDGLGAHGRDFLSEASFLEETLRKSGLSIQEARDRASLIGAAWRGSRNLDDPDYRMKLIGIAASD